MSDKGPLAPEKWWNDASIAIVTGGNKGIGYEISKLLAAQGILTIVTARNVELGTAAVAKLKEQAGPAARIEFQQLDVTDQASIERFATWVETTHGTATILINNAGIATWTLSASEVQRVLDTNFYAVKAMVERFTPLMVKGGRIINVSSELGYSGQIKDAPLLERFTSATSVAPLLVLAKELVQAVQDDKQTELGWVNATSFGPAYSLTKLFCSQYTRIVGPLHPGIMINACCPGYCATDLNGQSGPNTAASGADTPVWLALKAPSDFHSGEFFAGRTSLPYDHVSDTVKHVLAQAAAAAKAAVAV